MKLYYAPGACSLADHIALREARLEFDLEKVDLKAKTTEHGEDFRAVNPKGYVPALTLDAGGTITENIALLSWIAEQAPDLAPSGDLGRIRLLEVLAFVSTEIHKSFKPFFMPGASDADKAKAGDAIHGRMETIARDLDGDYLFGSTFTVADAYLFVMLMWAKRNGIDLPDPLPAYFDRVKARPAVAEALAREGLG